jgi:hypothetical protein
MLVIGGKIIYFVIIIRLRRTKIKSNTPRKSFAALLLGALALYKYELTKWLIVIF